MYPSKPQKKRFFFPGLRCSIGVLWHHAKIRRLFREDKGVEGVGWYAKYCEDFWHIPLNTLRFIILMVFTPIYVILRFTILLRAKASKGSIADTQESAYTPDAMLYESPGHGQPDEFGPMGHPPRWMLEVTFRGQDKPMIRQVPVEGNVDILKAGYTAISYAMDSAFELFKEAGRQAKDPQPSQSRRWSLRDRERISRQVLYEYAQARCHEGKSDSTEFIWLDEFCLSPETLTDEQEIRKERMKELGRLTDIFRNAKRVLVFCHSPGCRHTTLGCPWGQRVFTISEILHAQDVITMTQFQEQDSTTELIERGARESKSEMQREAAQAEYHHLSTILLHATNAGHGSWQSTIQALVVETIRRDKAGNYLEHNYLGKALNGLLPRRARSEDVQGKDGWADLAWLLELNQGYYNAATLAAVCQVNLTPTRRGSGSTTGQLDAGVAGYRWWGKPILPVVGNERLEPKATAFPVVIERHRNWEAGSTQQEGGPRSGLKQEPALCITAPKGARINHTLRRDRDALHRHESMVSLRTCTSITAVIMINIGIPLIVIKESLLIPSPILIYLAFVTIVFVELLASTVYVVRRGWVFLLDEEWGEDPSHALGERDHRFKRLQLWGKRQMIPSWDPQSVLDGQNSTHRLISGSLVDLDHKVYTKVSVIDEAYPHLLVVLALHGVGVTCILLHKPGDDDDIEEEELESGDTGQGTGIFLGGGAEIFGGSLDGSVESLSTTSEADALLERDGEDNVLVKAVLKVGMANVPPYVLSKNRRNLGRFTLLETCQRYQELNLKEGCGLE